MSYSSFLNEIYPVNINETQKIDRFLQSNECNTLLSEHKDKVSDRELSDYLNQAILRLCHASLDESLTNKYRDAIRDILSFISSQQRDVKVGDPFLLALLDEKQELVEMLLPVKPNGYCYLTKQTAGSRHKKEVGKSFIYISIRAFLTMKLDDENIGIALVGLNRILDDFNEEKRLNAQFVDIFNEILSTKGIDPNQIYQRIKRLNACIRVHLLSAALFSAMRYNRVADIKPLLEMGALISRFSYLNDTIFSYFALGWGGHRVFFVELLKQMSLQNRLLSIPGDCPEPTYKTIKPEPFYTNSSVRIESECLLFNAFLRGDFEVFELLLKVGYPVKRDFFSIIQAQHHYRRDGYHSPESDAYLERFRQLLLKTLPVISNRIRLFDHVSYAENPDGFDIDPLSQKDRVFNPKVNPEIYELYLKVLKGAPEYEAEGILKKDCELLMADVDLFDNDMIGALLNKAVVAQFKSNLGPRIKSGYQGVIEAIFSYLKQSGRRVCIGDGIILAILAHHEELVEQLSSYKPHPKCKLTKATALNTPYNLCKGMNLLDLAIMDYGDCCDEKREKAQNYVYLLLKRGAKPGPKTFDFIKKYYNEDIFFLALKSGLPAFKKKQKAYNANEKYFRFVRNRLDDLISIKAPVCSFIKLLETKHLSRECLEGCLDDISEDKSLFKAIVNELDCHNKPVHRRLAELALVIAVEDGPRDLCKPLIDKGAFQQNPYQFLYRLKGHIESLFDRPLFKELIKYFLEKYPDLFDNPTEECLKLVLVFVRDRELLEELNLFLNKCRSYPESDICLLGEAFKYQNIDAFKALFIAGVSPSQGTLERLTQDYKKIVSKTVVDYSRCRFFGMKGSNETAHIDDPVPPVSPY